MFSANIEFLCGISRSLPHLSIFILMIYSSTDFESGDEVATQKNNISFEKEKLPAKQTETWPAETEMQ